MSETVWVKMKTERDVSGGLFVHARVKDDRICVLCTCGDPECLASLISSAFVELTERSGLIPQGALVGVKLDGAVHIRPMPLAWHFGDRPEFIQ